MEQLRLTERVSQGKYPHDRTIGNQGERFPVKIIRPDISLGEDDKRDWLIARDQRELLGRDLHLQRSTPVVPLDRREVQVAGPVHTPTPCPRRSRRTHIDINLARPLAA